MPILKTKATRIAEHPQGETNRQSLRFRMACWIAEAISHQPILRYVIASYLTVGTLCAVPQGGREFNNSGAAGQTESSKSLPKSPHAILRWRFLMQLLCE